MRLIPGRPWCGAHLASLQMGYVGRLTGCSIILNRIRTLRTPPGELRTRSAQITISLIQRAEKQPLISTLFGVAVHPTSEAFRAAFDAAQDLAVCYLGVPLGRQICDKLPDQLISSECKLRGNLRSTRAFMPAKRRQSGSTGDGMTGLLGSGVRELQETLERCTFDPRSIDFEPDVGVLTAILDALPNYVWICDAELRETVYISSACERLLGLPRTELLGDCRRLLKRVHASDRQKVLRARQSAMQRDYEQLYRIVRPDGEIRWIQDRGFPLHVRNGLLIAGIAEDVTERKALEQQLVGMAYFDSLTQLPNRTLFYDRLEQSLAHARRNSWNLAVLFIDVDHFKHVNDTAGHHAGDELLKQIAHRLALCVRNGDTVARFGGDEFAMVLNSVKAPADAGLVAEKVLLQLGAAVQIGGREFRTSASIGIAVYPQDATEQQALLRRADAAMYVAKQSGRNNYRFYGALQL